MSITDELREYVRHYSVAGSSKDKTLTAIADRIDEAHKHAIAYVDDRDPETMAEHGWVKLPLDADGVPIHAGDVMESVAEGVRGIVCRIQYWVDTHGDMQARIMAHLLDASGAYWYDREEVRHYHKPTVEDVLDEFVARWMDTHHDDLPALKAEYAAKLRLAGDGE